MRCVCTQQTVNSAFAFTAPRLSYAHDLHLTKIHEDSLVCSFVECCAIDNLAIRFCRNKGAGMCAGKLLLPEVVSSLAPTGALLHQFVAKAVVSVVVHPSLHAELARALT